MDKSNEEEAIPIGAMDVPPLIATVGHMPDGSGTLQAERSRHEEGRRKNRNTLRIYDIDGQQTTLVTVRVFGIHPIVPGSTGVGKEDQLLGEKIIALQPFGAEAPGYAELGDLSQIAPLGNEQKVALEVEPLTPGLRMWAFVSITNNETQHVTVIAPQ
jgi:hypothetical protein